MWPKGCCPISAAEYIHSCSAHGIAQELHDSSLNSSIAQHSHASQFSRSTLQIEKEVDNSINHQPTCSTPQWSNPSEVVASSSRPGVSTTKDGEGQDLAIKMVGQAVSHGVEHASTVANTQVCIVESNSTPHVNSIPEPHACVALSAGVLPQAPLKVPSCLDDPDGF